MTCLTKEQKYRNMAANKSKGTKLEVLFGKLLWNAGVRYRKNDNKVFGTPDFVIRKMKIAIFFLIYTVVHRREICVEEHLMLQEL